MTCLRKRLLLRLVILCCLLAPGQGFALSSTNIPLDSPLYLYLEKLAGFGLLDTDVQGLKPYSRSEAARLLLEAEKNMASRRDLLPPLAGEISKRVRELLPRELHFLSSPQDAPPGWDINPAVATRLRYLHLAGEPRSYVRDVYDPANQSAFSFIGGNLRPQSPGIIHTTGSEGTPLLENNEGVLFRDGNNLEVRHAMEGYLAGVSSLLLEPQLLHVPGSTELSLHRGYLKLGGGGLELEVGRDANWFGPGYRGATTLTNNARNFDLVKFSSPEPLAADWVKKYLGEFKYALILSRFDETGSGDNLRHPWFVGLKLALKPKPWYEVGFNLVRQEGGPGFSGSPSLKERIFGGGNNDHVNSIAGFDLRFRISGLRNAELYGEYSGEDSAGFWPFVESYVAGVYLPDLTGSGRDDLRFEYFWGSVLLYGDWQFPAGYVYHGMTPGHSQGGAAQDFFLRYSHWYSPRNILALEYFHTDRGKVGKLAGQQTEYRNGGRISWRLPLYGNLDGELVYGYERVDNLNLEPGVMRSNQSIRTDISYRY